MTNPRPLDRCTLDADGVTYCRAIRYLDEASSLAWVAGAEDLSMDLMAYADTVVRDHLERQFDVSR